MLIIGILCFGILVGFLAELVVAGRTSKNWGRMLALGLAGSLVGGLLASLIAGDGLALRPSGIIGSLVGAIILTAIDKLVAARG